MKSFVFFRVCPLIDGKLRHNIFKAYVNLAEVISSKRRECLPNLTRHGLMKKKKTREYLQYYYARLYLQYYTQLTLLLKITIG